MIRRILNLKKNLHKREKGSVASIQFVEVLPSQKLDLIYAWLQDRPFVVLETDYASLG